jgi:hypothetical protein
MIRDLGQAQVQCQGVDLTFQHQTFESDDKLIHVFYCLWTERISSETGTLVEDGSQLSRLRATLAGKRHLGQQVLEIVIQGPESDDEAVALCRTRLAEMIKPEP